MTMRKLMSEREILIKQGFEAGKKELYDYYFKNIKNPVILSKEEYDNMRKRGNLKEHEKTNKN